MLKSIGVCTRSGADTPISARRLLFTTCNVSCLRDQGSTCIQNKSMKVRNQLYAILAIIVYMAATAMAPNKATPPVPNAEGAEDSPTASNSTSS
mmetsp:Transcript_27567/g.67039  ORF Transcript_27567/g.67039 Transcript_27567/m.67039 type:complete len:94 (+) Transcript_27567:91-372(+)